MIAEGDNDERGKQAKNTLKGKEKFEAAKWKPGQSGNPSGRPKGSINLTNRLRAALAARDGVRADKIIESLLDKAEEGDARHLIEVFNRIDGKVADKVEQDTELRVVVKYVKEGIHDHARSGNTTT